MKQKSIAERAAHLTLDLLYPRRCPFCSGIAPAGKDVCPECLETLPYVWGPVCAKCGKPVEEGETLCGDCQARPRVFDAGCAAFLYDDQMRETIRLFKYKGRKEYGEVLGRLLAHYAAEELAAWRPELIAAVPVHRGKLRQRGYNQAEVLARSVSDSCGIPFRKELLLRPGSTEAMKNLGAEDRRRNLEGVFSARPEELALDGKRRAERVLVVDDIFTTGATMDACAAVLKEAGVRKMYFLAVCIGAGAAAEF